MSFKYFKREEFACHETGENEIKDAFIHRLDELRERCGFPFRIVSGYRSPKHSIEAAKPGGPGWHSRGVAADIHVDDGIQRRAVVEEALRLGFGGIGPAHSYVHVDDRDSVPVIWTYDKK